MLLLLPVSFDICSGYLPREREEEEHVEHIRPDTVPLARDPRQEWPIMPNIPSRSIFSSKAPPPPPPRPSVASNLGQRVIGGDGVIHPPPLQPKDSRPIGIRNEAHATEVLEAYQREFGGDSGESIVTPITGKMNGNELTPNYRLMPPRLSASYRVDDLSFELVTLPLLASDFLDHEQYEVLAQVNKRFNRLIPKHLYWKSVDVSSLLEPRWDYSEQTEIQQDRVDMASALFIRFGGDPEKLIRICAQEYMLANLEREKILDAVKDKISDDDWAHLKRILFDGCPAEFHFDESRASRSQAFSRGNHSSYRRNPEKTAKAMNKEDKYSHVLPIDEDVAILSPYTRHTPQSCVDKTGKSFRVVWDGSTRKQWNDTMLNDVTPSDKEPHITFGETEEMFDKRIFNLRVSYPLDPILLATADITSCYKFPRFHPALSGAFGFLDGNGLFFLATSMVFGSKVSAQCWEPSRRGIQALSKLLQSKGLELVRKHNAYLQMIKWDETQYGECVKAARCPICPGVLDENGEETKEPSRFYVDDALLAAIRRRQMEIALAATIEAIFLVMGRPDTTRRRCPLSLEKWQQLVVSPKQVLLGLSYDTIKLTKGTTPEYRADLRKYMEENWPPERCSFDANDMQVLIGKLSRLAKGARWVYYILSHAYDEIAKALASNYRLLKHHSSSFRALIAQIKKLQMGKNKLSQQEARIVSFALKTVSRLIHRSKCSYPISANLAADIDFFRTALQVTSTVPWVNPIGHCILRTPRGIPYGDSSLRGCGGYCVALNFWWHLNFPPEIVNRTLLYLRDDSNDDLISINALEFITVILNYCAALHVISSSGILSDDPHPVVLCKTDNTSALNWVNHRSKGSPLGRALGRLFVGLIMDSPLGINAEWINTNDNEIADEISRLKKDSDKEFSFDYSQLKQKFHGTLKDCQRWYPSTRLISIIYRVLLTRQPPILEDVRSLRPSDLGRLGM